MPLSEAVKAFLREMGISDKLIKKAEAYYDMTRDKGTEWASKVHDARAYMKYIKSYSHAMGVSESRAKEFADEWLKKMQNKTAEDWQSAVGQYAAAAFALGVAGVKLSEEQGKRLLSITAGA